MAHFVFTLTAGRTGTAWLAELFRLNGVPGAIHEYFQFGDIGVRSQDIQTMQEFNLHGNTDQVKAFWKRKLGLLPNVPFYVETNHALAKCGLVENLRMLPKGSEVTLISIGREWRPHALSFLNRFDFQNITVPWLWYLDMRYNNVIVPSAPMRDFGIPGHVLWYMAEMDARRAYYRKLCGGGIRVIETSLEEMTTQAGAKDLLAQFGIEGAIHLPEKMNRNVKSEPTVNVDELDKFIARIKFDPESMAEKYIDAGRRLDVVPRVPAHPAGTEGAQV